MTSEIEIERRVRAIMRRPYTRSIRGEPAEGYLAWVHEFPGCLTAGDTPEEALALLDDATAVWLASRLHDGLAVPEPEPPPGHLWPGFSIAVPSGPAPTPTARPGDSAASA